MDSPTATNDTESQYPTPTEHVPAVDRGWLLWLWRWFWRVTLVVSLAYAWYCFYVPSNSIAWAGSYTAAQQEAVESGKPMILFFTGKWCVPCRIMKRTVWADEQVTAKVNTSFIPLTIDVNQPDATEMFHRYNVAATPTTIIIDPQGNVLRQQAGGMDKPEFLELLGSLEASAKEGG